jgi:outer membrane protein insertion porin family
MTAGAFSSRFATIFGIVCLLTTAQPTLAQMAAPIVRRIDIQFVGTPSISKERVLANIGTKEGLPYNEHLAEQDVRALYATGAVSNVRIFAEPLGEGVSVVVLVQGLPSIDAVYIQGNSQIPMARIRKEISSKVGEVLSEDRLEEDRQKIIALYEGRNYGQVRVTLRVEPVPGKKRVQVFFNIQEGVRMIVQKISFVGNSSIPDKDLRRAIKTKTRNLLFFINKSGRLVPSQLDEDKDAIRFFYQNHGFADVRCMDVRVQPNQRKDGVDLTYTLQEGTQYRVNSIRFEGLAAAKPQELASLLKMKAGSLYTPEGLNSNLKIINDFYGVRGYVDRNILSQVTPAGPSKVDLLFSVDEGVQSYVNLVNIQGNTRTKDRVIRRELVLKPGQVFDTTLMDISRNRLQNLNYFSRVDLVPQSTLVPGRKDLNVILEEKGTGNFNFGAGFSTIDSLVGFAELQETNFDLFGWPTFRGGGQRFRIRGQYGIERSDFVAALTEPWFLGYKLSAGPEGYYHEADYLSDVYEQATYGGDFQLRAPITKFLSAHGEYRIQGIRIYDIDTKNAGSEIRNSAGFYTQSMFSGGFDYDTRDDLFLPRRGSTFNFTAFISGGGLGGNVNDYGLSLEGTHYLLLPFDMIFMAKGQIAVVNTVGAGTQSPYNRNVNLGVPIFDRLYLGGANNMRGFQFRDVGPKDQYGNAIGGDSLAYITLEITFPIVPRIRGAIFTDWGFVNAAAYDYSLNNINGDVGVGIRLDLPIGAPIRLDFGYPVKTDNFNKSSGQFQFNIGYQF